MGELSALRAVAPERHVLRSRRTSISILSDGTEAFTPGAPFRRSAGSAGGTGSGSYRGLPGRRAASNPGSRTQTRSRSARDLSPTARAAGALLQRAAAAGSVTV